MFGPFPGDRNDAQIMKDCVEDPSSLDGFLKTGDVCLVDRGFRGVKPQLERMSLTFHVPALKTVKQLITGEAESSRFVTKAR